MGKSNNTPSHSANFIREIKQIVTEARAGYLKEAQEQMWSYRLDCISYRTET
jgi:hypothetical protein